MQCRDNQHIQKFNPIQFGIFMVLLASIHVFMSNKTLYMGIFGSTENKIKFSNSPKKKKIEKKVKKIKFYKTPKKKKKKKKKMEKKREKSIFTHKNDVGQDI